MTEHLPAKNTSDTAPQPAKYLPNKRGWIFAGIATTVLAAMFFGPNARQAYLDAQDIEKKAGPARDYIEQALAKTVLSSDRPVSTILDHSCSRGPKFSPGEEERYCRVRAHAVYVLHGVELSYVEQRDVATEKFKDAGIELNNYWGAGNGGSPQMVTVEGQTLRVGASLTASTGAMYNHSRPYETDKLPIAVNDSVLEVDLVAYTVDYAVPEYLYNDETP